MDRGYPVRRCAEDRLGRITDLKDGVGLDQLVTEQAHDDGAVKPRSACDLGNRAVGVGGLYRWHLPTGERQPVRAPLRQPLRGAHNRARGRWPDSLPRDTPAPPAKGRAGRRTSHRPICHVVNVNSGRLNLRTASIPAGPFRHLHW